MSSYAKGQNFGKERLGEAQRAKEASSRVLAVCISIGKLDVRRHLFLGYLCAKLL